MTFYITLCTTVWFPLETEWQRIILIWHGIVFLNSWISYIYHLVSLNEECFFYSEAKFSICELEQETFMLFVETEMNRYALESCQKY
jgi:hypothetical protein